jgi:superoxide dismutase
LRTEVDRSLAGLQGSGWAVLSWEPVGERLIVQHVTDHQGQVVVGAAPLLVVDWSAVADRFTSARRSTSSGSTGG